MKHTHTVLAGAVVAAALLVTTLALLAAGGQGALAQDAVREQSSVLLGATIYVDAGATGANDGTSWEDAFTTLQPALDAAASGDEIWVAAGTYRPTVEHGGTGSRYRSFQMKNMVTLYGGFDPSAGDSTWEDRDWRHNVVTLSGDIGILGDASDNCYHVFFHPSGLNLNAAAILDGFTITGGNANGAAPHNEGGGMLNGGYLYRGSNPTLTNCIFEDNAAVRGGGMSNYLSSPTLNSCTFRDNVALDAGGGIYNLFRSGPVLTNCYFESNVGILAGGGMANVDASPALYGCTFRFNASDGGAGMYNTASSPVLAGCVFDRNPATIQGGGMLNSDHSSPRLTDCTFDRNEAGDLGGGMANDESDPVLTRCVLKVNSARRGGGMHNSASSPTLSHCILSINSADEDGGGMYNAHLSSPVLTGGSFWYNTAQLGGGMCNTGISAPVLAKVSFTGNSAIYDGGGMYNNYSAPLLSNCIFWGNSAEGGGAMYNYEMSSPVLTNCSFYGNHAAYTGGMANVNGSNPIVTNCILWGDTDTVGDPEIHNTLSDPIVTYSDVQGGYIGTGNLDEDPLYKDPENRDLHLKRGSPCVDVGDNLAPNLPVDDIDGDPRVRDGDRDGTATVDMGVDELGRLYYLPLIVSNQ